MITLYSGTPGSGKSLHIASDIRDRLRYQKDSITIGNFYVNTSSVKKRKGYYIKVENWNLTPERLLKFSRNLAKHKKRRLKEGEILIVIDEAQIMFNSRDWQQSRRNDWLSFFTQHRHYGYDVILIAQFDRMLDRQIRGLIEYDVIHRKIKNAGKFGSLLGFLTGGNMFLSIKRWYPISEKIDMKFYFGNKNLYSLYDSYNHFSQAKEKQVNPKRLTSGA